MKKLIGLIFVVISSFLMVSTYKMGCTYGQQYDHSYDSLKLFGPGILFSGYIIAVRFGQIPPLRSLVYFIIMIAAYVFSVGASFASWGVAVPFVGAAGAVLIKCILEQNLKVMEQASLVYLITGFVCGLFGVSLFYLMRDAEYDGIGFGFILAFWQLFIGLVFLKGLEQETPQNNLLNSLEDEHI